jgi:hypothetical protein
MFRKLFLWIHKYERHVSAAAMAAGFVVDNIFFKRFDVWQTQAVFATYTVICFLTIPLLHWIEARATRGISPPRWRSVLPILTQFSLGGFWSGFFVFYTRSAVLFASWPFLLLIIAFLIGNEYFSKYHDRLVFTSVLFFFALYCYAVFAVPIYTGTIGTTTFLESGAVAVAVFALFTIVLRILGRQRFLADVRHIRIGAFIVVILINLFYFTNILPPIPLSAQAGDIYHLVWRAPGAYLAQEESEPWQVRYLGFPPTIHVVLGTSLYAYSAVFAPTALTTTIVHQWQWYDPITKKWITKAVISYSIVGGRDGGYRGYSAVPIIQAGAWRVNIETIDGRLIARFPFTVVSVTSAPVVDTVTLTK